jgi:hypothetical protein
MCRFVLIPKLERVKDLCEKKSNASEIQGDPKKRTAEANNAKEVNGSSTMAASSRSLSSPTADLPTRGNVKEASTTGFVLKLNNMVNGAPDDIVSVSG